MTVDVVIAVADRSIVVSSPSFISTVEHRLAALFSLAMSSSSSVRHRRAATVHNATVQVVACYLAWAKFGFLVLGGLAWTVWSMSL